MSDKDELGAFLLGFIVGGLAGAVTSLLLAPQSGAETRTVIREKAIELKDRAGDTWDDAYSKAEAAAAEARTRFEDLAQRAKTQAEELQSRGQVVLESIKKKEGKPPVSSAKA